MEKKEKWEVQIWDGDFIHRYPTISIIPRVGETIHLKARNYIVRDVIWNFDEKKVRVFATAKTADDAVTLRQRIDTIWRKVQLL
jgi:hypothetical protein